MTVWYGHQRPEQLGFGRFWQLSLFVSLCPWPREMGDSIFAVGVRVSGYSVEGLEGASLSPLPKGMLWELPDGAMEEANGRAACLTLQN